MTQQLTHPNTQEQTTPQTKSKRTSKTRFLPALGLFFLSPLVGEFLLGNLPITWLWALISLAPLYGAGTLLIRETSRRFGLGWPGMIVLGLAYAVIEEAFVTQSLFNPNYVGLRLLDYGFIPALGISGWWTVFVLGIHTIWSTAVPIALVESLTPSARRTPWLGPVGIVITVVLFVLGCAMTYFFQQAEMPFMASTMQLVVSGVVVVLLVIIAFMLGRGRHAPPTETENPPAPRTVGIVFFLLASVFLGVVNMPEVVPALVTVLGMLALLGAGCWLLWQWSRRVGWWAAHELAAASGLLLTYAWYGFIQRPSVPGTTPMVDSIGNAVFAAAAILLLVFAWRRIDVHKEAVPSI